MLHFRVNLRHQAEKKSIKRRNPTGSEAPELLAAFFVDLQVAENLVDEFEVLLAAVVGVRGRCGLRFLNHRLRRSDDKSEEKNQLF